MLKANRKWISYSVVMNTTSSSPSPFMQKTRHSVQLLDFSNIPEDKNIETKGTQNPAISYPCQSILFRWLLSRHTVSIHAYTWVWIIYVVWYYEGHTYSVKNGCSLRIEKIFFRFFFWSIIYYQVRAFKLLWTVESVYQLSIYQPNAA